MRWTRARAASGMGPRSRSASRIPARRSPKRERKPPAASPPEAIRSIQGRGGGTVGGSWVVIVARAISDPTRYRMLQEIRAAGEMTCGELHARFPLSQATVSHHIKTLQQAGLLRVRAEGLFRHLSAETARLSAFAAGGLPAPSAPRPPPAP